MGKPLQQDVGALSRRNFLVTAFGGALAFGYSRGAEAAIDIADSRSPVNAGAPPFFAPTMWYTIDSRGVVRINLPKAEMGQHIGTAFARILAEELEADWGKVRVIGVDFSPKWNPMITGGSTSVSLAWPDLCKAGAAGRLALLEAAASFFGVSADACQARNGMITAPSGQIAYGDLVQKQQFTRTFKPEELKQLPLKPASERRLIGKKVAAIDIPEKTNGAALYSIDAKAPGMVYARPIVPPTRWDSTIVSIDDSKAKEVPGYLQTIKIDDPSNVTPGWALVIAENFPDAIKACDLVKVVYNNGENSQTSEEALQKRARELIDDRESGSVVKTYDWNTKDVFKSADRIFEQTYTTSTALHAQLEPLSVLAFEADGVLQVHAGLQAQTATVSMLAKALQRPENTISLPTYLLGGGFGRRLDGDFTIPAALATVKLGRPVKLIFMRPDDLKFDGPRTCSMQTVRMAFDSSSKILGQEHDACAGWPTLAHDAKSMMKQSVDGKLYDNMAVDGANHWYAISPLRVRAIMNDLAQKTVRSGWLRSVGPGWTNWALESFMDEVARMLKRDPIEFRLSLLTGAYGNTGEAPYSSGGALRQANVVRICAQRAQWGLVLPTNSAQGFATTFGMEREHPTWLACVARVAVDDKSGAIKVEKLTAVIDAGTIVDPGGAMAQVSGALMWGLSLALHEGSKIVKGVPQDHNFDTYTPLRMYQTPELDIYFVPSTEAPTGLGEPGVTVVAPAIANAIHSAVGVRLRHLPMRPGDVQKAMKQTK